MLQPLGPLTAPRERSVRAVLGRFRPFLTATVVVAVFVNAVVAGAYFWSRDGQQTHARVEISGDTVRTYVDGRLHITADAPIAPGTEVVLQFESTDTVPSLPSPRGIDRITVTNLASGEVLFEESFRDLPSTNDPRWSALEGELFVQSGVLGSRTDALLAFDPGAADEYALDVRYRNVTGATLVVRAERTPDGVSGVTYSFRPFRHFDGVLVHRVDGEAVDVVAGPRLEFAYHQPLRSILGTALAPYPLVLVLLAAGVVVVALAQFAFVPRALHLLPDWSAWTTRAVVIAIVLASFGTTAFIINSYGSGMPHVPDEQSYLFQAKVLAAGRLAVPPPAVVEPFGIGVPPLVGVNDGKWASVYPFGHPLMLAVGERFGLVSYVPPLVGAACVLLVFLLGRRLYGTRVGVLAAILLAASPFFLMNASNFMSHNTTAFYLLMSLFLLATADRRPWVMTALSGVFLGLVFASRPLTGVALVPPFALFLAVPLVWPGRRVDTVKRGLVFAAAGFAMLLLYWAYRYGTTGDPFYVEPIQGGPNALGFSGEHNFDRGMSNQQTQMGYLALVLHNWPISTGLVLALLPFVLGTRLRWDWFLLGCAVCMMSAYVAYFYDGLMYGPRFWYEAAPLLILLTARGADRAAGLIAAAVQRVEVGPRPWPKGTQRASLTIVYALLISFAALGVHDWLRGDSADWRSDHVPRHAQDLRRFNGVDDRLVREIRDAGLENALVLVDECPQWWCFGSVAWMNSPWLDGDVVIARYLDDHVDDLLAAFPDRDVYRAAYTDPPVLESYDPQAAPGPEDDGTGNDRSG